MKKNLVVIFLCTSWLANTQTLTSVNLAAPVEGVAGRLSSEAPLYEEFVKYPRQESSKLQRVDRDDQNPDFVVVHSTRENRSSTPVVIKVGANKSKLVQDYLATSPVEIFIDSSGLYYNSFLTKMRSLFQEVQQDETTVHYRASRTYVYDHTTKKFETLESLAKRLLAKATPGRVPSDFKKAAIWMGGREALNALEQVNSDARSLDTPKASDSTTEKENAHTPVNRK